MKFLFKVSLFHNIEGKDFSRKTRLEYINHKTYFNYNTDIKIKKKFDLNFDITL